MDNCGEFDIGVGIEWGVVVAWVGNLRFKIYDLRLGSKDGSGLLNHRDIGTRRNTGECFAYEQV